MILRDLHLQLLQATTVRMHHLEQVAVQLYLLALLGQVAEGVHHQAAYRIYLFIAELGAEEVVEILDLGQGADGEDPLADAADLFRLILDVVKLVVNLANDQFSMSSMVTRPETPPNSSTTMAMW